MAKTIKLSALRKLIAKTYERLVLEALQREHGVVATRRGRKGKAAAAQASPSLCDFLEDSLLLQYGMRSMARKTLLQARRPPPPLCAPHALTACMALDPSGTE